MMTLTQVKTEKVPGRISHVYIGKSGTDGVDIMQGIKSFEYGRIHDAVRNRPPGSGSSPTINMQQPGFFRWRLEFSGDCRVAFFATDVGVASGNQFALVPDGLSNEIEFFQVVMPIEDKDGNPKTRTYYIYNGYALRNGATIGDDEDAIYWYEGEAEQIVYGDA